MASARKRGTMYTGYWRVDGKQKSKGGFVTETEAMAHALQEERTARATVMAVAYPAAKRGQITVAAYLPRWLAEHRMSQVTRENYTRSAQHIIRELGTRTVERLDDAACERLIRTLEKRGLASATVKNVAIVVRGMCRAAFKDPNIGLTSVPEFSTPTVRNREMQIATPEQARMIQANLPAHYKLLCETLFATGVRYGEAMGLGPEHVVLNAGHAVLRVGRRTVVEVGNHRPMVQDHGKTSAARRDVVISLDLAKRLLAGARDGYLFRAARGGYLDRNRFRRVWVKACLAAGVPGLRVHDARHSHASWLANDPRMPLAAVRDRLGHSSLSVTSRYVHSMTQPDVILSVLAA